MAIEPTDQDLEVLRQAIRVTQRARDHGNHPFGAVLVNRAGAVLMEGENSVITGHDATGHAEMNLVRMACREFDATILEQCTLYSSTEPCPIARHHKTLSILLHSTIPL